MKHQKQGKQLPLKFPLPWNTFTGIFFELLPPLNKTLRQFGNTQNVKETIIIYISPNLPISRQTFLIPLKGSPLFSQVKKAFINQQKSHLVYLVHTCTAILQCIYTHIYTYTHAECKPHFLLLHIYAKSK